MKISHHDISLRTQAPIQIIDVTRQVKDLFADSGIRNGICTLISRHTTACVNLNEQEPMLQRDMLTHLKRLVPRDGDYLHNENPVDGRDNAHSHLMGLFMNASETIPIVDGALVLGTWQSIFFIELDGPRPERHLTVHFMGTD
ncbi:secondary thiamine-phosphate synthase enzyme YjbQ [Ectothiorhodospira lacustris]|uniref:secondary thiamine-phosphate synthase enzyme YjbQ n=1 Tax=Ectothiorhodospira lacustris TaxID=2899127 RepID=UPI001EE7C7DE|nr:secondary thiamine-phosphate synthase enzyme YjbQ [Ectothiorhodospira lacustris]MCG5500945.1 secondary thiamine-phosphate synthase enzyme YjbQ [Ectothiorhodospira lacustris]MCG5510692.1 secondary thiamine-phosphate synthase enzyme YjbQ [Ectothiorhodospira lacustris]MCG5522408.1 secondary thiamine-phosphate synthase enzyme YjbQ [Ectothiorhodospira lacustris]